MSAVEPIHNKKVIENVKKNFKETKIRDKVLFMLGINSGLRISDLLRLRIEDVKDKNYIEIKEQKTNKYKHFPITKNLKIILDNYIENKTPNLPLFPSQKSKFAITSVQAYRIITKICKKAGVKENVGTHTLRKTFGYHFYKQTKDVAMLQNILNHSVQNITLRYIGITQDMIKLELKRFEL